MRRVPRRMASKRLLREEEGVGVQLAYLLDSCMRRERVYTPVSGAKKGFPSSRASFVSLFLETLL